MCYQLHHRLISFVPVFRILPGQLQPGRAATTMPLLRPEPESTRFRPIVRKQAADTPSSGGRGNQV